MKTIVLCNVKGGTGKSTLSIVIALTLAQSGKRVLCVDLDAQNSLTYFFVNNTAGKSIFNYFIGSDYQSNIIHTDYGVDLLASDLRLLDLRTIETNRIKQLQNKLLDYDYMIIDTAPTYDNLTINAYYAADTIIMPSTVDVFAVKTCHFLLDKLEALDISANIGIVLNMWKPSKSKNIKSWTIREAGLFFNDTRLKEYLCKSHIPRSNTLHKLIAIDGYKIKGNTIAGGMIQQFVSEITNQKINVNYIDAL